VALCKVSSTQMRYDLDLRKTTVGSLSYDIALGLFLS